MDVWGADAVRICENVLQYAVYAAMVGFVPLRYDVCGSVVECLIVCALYVCLLSFGFVGISGLVLS